GRYQAVPGLNLFRDRHGQVALSTWAGFPAEQAGVLEGDVLLAINHVPLALRADQPLENVLPVAPAGTSIVLTVQTGDLPPRDVQVSYGGGNAPAPAPVGPSVGLFAAFFPAVFII